MTSANVQTKILTIVFSAWAEARFSKLIHTPYGFDLTEIRQIKSIQQQYGLEQGWEKCLQLALRRGSPVSKGSEIPNKRQAISRILKTYIIEPSLLRNKIAHGQWKVALNRDNDTENPEFTAKLRNLDVIVVTVWLQAYEFLARIIEDLIESPNRAFRRDYWLHLSQLESFLSEAKHWTIESKMKTLKLKARKGPNLICDT